MSRKFQCKVIPSTWLDNNGRRLDCGPYLSGAVEAKERLKRHRTEPLRKLTGGHDGGIFNGPRFPRIYVHNPTNGVPFLGSTDILDADLSFVSLLSKKQVEKNPALVLDEGWTLITCSGTIGRMAYARSDMKGMAGSQDFMRVVPDVEKINPGYLYAYLSSRFGVPLIVSGTYGAIIQHIEPHHIAGLSVPRLGDIEDQAHDLIQKAAELRTEASSLIKESIRRMEDAAELPHLDHHGSESSGFDVGTVPSGALLGRLDALFHSRYHQEVTEAVAGSSSGAISVGKIAISIVEPTRFKRLPVDNEAFGVPFFGTTALMWADPKPSYFLSKRQKGVEEYLVTHSNVLIPRSGQLSGLIGTAVLPYGRMVGGGVTEDAIRINCNSKKDAGYLFVALRSEYGRRQLKARACGSSIPHLNVHQIAKVIVPKLNNEKRDELGEMGLRTTELRDQAIIIEDQARSLVERAIEEGGR
jgi:type I restriction enzyme, S subunit